MEPGTREIRDKRYDRRVIDRSVLDWNLQKEVTTMKAKHIQLTGKERIMLQTMIKIELRSNVECEKMGIKPGFETETLESIYQKLSGHKSGEV